MPMSEVWPGDEGLELGMFLPPGKGKWRKGFSSSRLSESSDAGTRGRNKLEIQAPW